MAPALVLSLSQCSFEEPIAPTWNVLFTIPLLSKTYTMVDIADDVDELIIDEENQEVILNLEKQIETDKVGDRLRVPGAYYEEATSGGSVTDSLGIPPDVAIVYSSTIKEGSLHIEIVNQNDVQNSAHFETPDLIDSEGNPISIDVEIAAGVGEVTRHEITLNDHIFQPALHDGQNFIRFELSLSNREADVILRILSTDLVFSSFTGILNNLEVAVNSTVQDLSIPELFKDFEMQSVNLKVAMALGAMFPANLDIKIEALETRSGTIPPPIYIQEHVAPVDPAGIDTVEIGDVTEFINSHPVEVLISGNIYVGDGIVASTISEDHVFLGTAIFQAPLTVSIPPFETKMDVDTLELDEDVRELIRDNLIQADIVTGVESRVPLGANISIFFSSTAGDSMIYEPGNYDLRFDIPVNAAPTEGDPGIVCGSEHSTFSIGLDKDDLELFAENEKVYLGFIFEFLSSTAQVQLRPVDSMDIEAYISALVNSDIEE